MDFLELLFADGSNEAQAAQSGSDEVVNIRPANKTSKHERSWHEIIRNSDLNTAREETRQT